MKVIEPEVINESFYGLFGEDNDKPIPIRNLDNDYNLLKLFPREIQGLNREDWEQGYANLFIVSNITSSNLHVTLERLSDSYIARLEKLSSLLNPLINHYSLNNIRTAIKLRAMYEVNAEDATNKALIEDDTCVCQTANPYKAVLDLVEKVEKYQRKVDTYVKQELYKLEDATLFKQYTLNINGLNIMLEPAEYEISVSIGKDYTHRVEIGSLVHHHCGNTFSCNCYSFIMNSAVKNIVRESFDETLKNSDKFFTDFHKKNDRLNKQREFRTPDEAIANLLSTYKKAIEEYRQAIKEEQNELPNNSN